MQPMEIFNYVVLVFVLTTVIYVFLENKNNIQLPTLENQLKKESKHRLYISLVISLVLAIIIMLLKKK